MTANKYSQLSPKAAAVLHELGKASAASIAPSPPRQLDDDQSGVAKTLIDQGVLTRDPRAGRPVAPTVSALPVEHLLNLVPSTEPRIRAAHVAAFAWAAARATIELALVAWRGKGFDGAVRRLRARNARLREPDETEARELVAAFKELRIFWPRAYLCRFDSLALIHFLACFGLRARWVFGVRLDPFYAHCWVQDERRLYDEDIERIAQYQPIMVVG